MHYRGIYEGADDGTGILASGRQPSVIHITSTGVVHSLRGAVASRRD